MGDIWPYGPPRYTDWVQVYDEMRALGFGKGDSNIFAAIAGAEATYDLSVINDSPDTGDYSVGTFQINYFGGDGPPRTRQFGSPKHLINGGLRVQARAAQQIWAEQGFHAWSTYSDGDYKAWLHGNVPEGPSPAHQLQAPPAPTNTGKDSWHSQVTGLAGHFTGLANHTAAYTRALREVRRIGVGHNG